MTARPPTDHRYQGVKAETHRRLVGQFDLTALAAAPPDRVRREARALAASLARSADALLSDADRDRLVDDLMDEVFGLGPLEPLLADPTVTDILVNGPHAVYVERAGVLTAHPAAFADAEHLLRVIQRLAARVGRRVDTASPMVDARLPDGSRVNAVIPPLALDGPVLSVRRFGTRFAPADLVANGTLPPAVLAVLRAAVTGRVSLLVSGGTGSGKTTLLNALSAFIPATERLVTVEDTAELRLRQPHVVRLETRPANAEGVGEVRPRELVRNALRMRPDRILVGECRGPEALDMLQAMNTGHEGSLTTVHANTPRDALARLEVMVATAGLDLPLPVVRRSITSAVRLVVQTARLAGGPRRVVAVAEVAGVRRGRYAVRTIFRFKQTGLTDGVAVGHFEATGRVPRFLTRLAAAGIDLPRDLFTKGLVPRAD